MSALADIAFVVVLVAAAAVFVAFKVVRTLKGRSSCCGSVDSGTPGADSSTSGCGDACAGCAQRCSCSH